MRSPNIWPRSMITTGVGLRRQIRRRRGPRVAKPGEETPEGFARVFKLSQSFLRQSASRHVFRYSPLACFNNQIFGVDEQVQGRGQTYLKACWPKGDVGEAKNKHTSFTAAE